MSSASSAVTYTSVYTNSEPGRVFWGAGEELSDGGSPRVIVYGYDGLPMQPVAPPSPDYIPGPEEPPTPPSDPEEDPKEYKDDETEDGPVNYPMDGGEDGDDDDGDLHGDDSDDEDEDEKDEDKEEEKEHLAPADSAVVVPTDSISLPPEAEVERLLAMPTPLPSPLILLSPPFAEERLSRIASTQALVDAVTAALPPPLLPPLPPSLYIPPPVDRRDDIPEFERPPRKRSCLFALGSMYEVEESSTARPTGGWGIYYGLVSIVNAEVRRRGIREVGYGIRDTWVDPAEAVPEIAPMSFGEDAQDNRTRIPQRVAMDSHRVDLLMGDMMTLQETIWIMKEEAYASREAWAHSIGLSQAVHHELQTHCDHVYAYETHIQAHLQLQSTLIQTHHQVHETRSQIQQTEMAELRDTDRRRKTHTVEILRVMRDMRREIGDMQAELLVLRGAAEN
ncbi:hypothetical protein Tco_1140469 [Tanacetum coccineum]